jgi:hypothetical protein
MNSPGKEVPIKVIIAASTRSSSPPVLRRRSLTDIAESGADVA